MSGPIVRSGPNPTYSANWDQVFGSKKTKSKSTTSSGSAKKTTKKKAAKKKA